MKKIACAVFVSMFITGVLLAQEQEDSQAMEQSPSQPFAEEGAEYITEKVPETAPQPLVPPPATVKLFFGDLTVSGTLRTGFEAAMTEQDGLKDLETQQETSGKWSFVGKSAEWQENRAELAFNYSLGRYGAFLMLQAIKWGPNDFSYSDSIAPRYAFIWANFMDDKIKFSMGKLYTGLLIYQILGEMPLWETEGYGSKFSFTDEDNFSARIEFKPIPGLNVGAQFFFIDNPRPGKSIGETGAFGELGLAASYNSSLFNAQLGVRFDSAVDTMTPGSTYSGESKTYLPAYYGSGNYLGTPLASAMMGGPKYKHAGEVIDQQTVGQLPDGTYGLVSTPATDPYYDGGHMAFFGFKLNAVPNVVAVAHGGFYNLGAFDKFGYGRFAEEIRYDGIFSRLGVGIILQQEFYGSDVFHDTMENSPFLQFMPELIYDLIKLPGMRIPLLTAKLFANFGICPDVLESYITIEPLLDMRMGTFDVKLSYAYSYAEYVDAANIEPATTHKIKCSLELMF